MQASSLILWVFHAELQHYLTVNVNSLFIFPVHTYIESPLFCPFLYPTSACQDERLSPGADVAEGVELAAVSV